MSTDNILALLLHLNLI